MSRARLFVLSLDKRPMPEFEGDKEVDMAPVLFVPELIFPKQPFKYATIEVGVDRRAGAEQAIFDKRLHTDSEPVFDWVCEALLRAVNDFPGQPLEGGFLVQVLAGHTSQPEMGGQGLGEFDEPNVQKGDPAFDGTGHGRLVSHHQEVVRQVRPGVEVKHLLKGRQVRHVTVQPPKDLSRSVGIGSE